MTDFPAKNKPPHNINVLERWLSEASKHSGVAAGRLRRWLGFMIVAAMLDNARDPDDGQPLFLIKGGVAMELRIDIGARATKDLDTAFRAGVHAVAEYLDPALRAGHGDFTATRTELEPVKGTGAMRCDIKLAYRGRSVITVKLEVADTESAMGDEIDHVPAKPLDHVGLAGPETVPCVAVRWQIAQKLHACTEVFNDRDNDRFRDLIDLQLLAALVEDHEWGSVKDACTEVFSGRGKHPWPPTVTVFETWAAGYRALAEETGLAVPDVADAAAAVTLLIERIDRS
jgi:hypothetical protein